MKHLILLALTFATLHAQAVIYTCQFGNPFSEVTYDSSTLQLNIAETSANKTETQIINNVNLTRLENGQYQMVSAENKVLMTLTATGSGSDGITNLIYPFSASADIDESNKGNGACETNYLRAEKPENSNSEDQI